MKTSQFLQSQADKLGEQIAESKAIRSKGVIEMMLDDQKTAREINEENKKAGIPLEDDVYIPQCEYCDGTGREAEYEIVTFDPVHQIQTDGKICFACGGSGRA